MKQIRYLTNNSTALLEEDVTSYLQDGWVLVGPIVVDTSDDGTQYIQAVGKLDLDL